MYQASNAPPNLSSNTNNFTNQSNTGQQQQQQQQYDRFNEEDSSTNTFKQPYLDQIYEQDTDREQIYYLNELENVVDSLYAKDFVHIIDQSEQKQSSNDTKPLYQQQYRTSTNDDTTQNLDCTEESVGQYQANNNFNQIKQQQQQQSQEVNPIYKETIFFDEDNRDYSQNNNNDLGLKDQNIIMDTIDDSRLAKPFVEIVEQPSKCALRFRYKCEGRSAGSLPGVNSTADNKTFPSIRINNYVGRAVVVISCVTKDPPYKSHPHNIVGKEGCKKGICTIVVNNEENMVRSFNSLGIQCVKRKDIEDSLSLRESIKVDPFRNGFAHKLNATNIDLNAVRLCFQVFITGNTPNKCDVPLTPVVSEPIHDKKAMSDLVITKLSHCSAPATGGREIILLCDRISKDDIQVRFYEERDGKIVWETYKELSPSDVHKQVAICFKSPKYHNENITQPVMARIQLKRVSDSQVSEPRLFQFLPCESDEDIISRKRQKIELFNMNHHALDSILQPNQHQHPALNRSPDEQVRLRHDHHLQPHPIHNHQQQQQLNAQACIISQNPQRNSQLECPSTPTMQARQASPIMQMNQQQQYQQTSPMANTTRPSTRSPQHTPSPTHQHQQHHQNNYMIDNQNLVVRREIIDNEGRVMQLVDRPATNNGQSPDASTSNNNNNNQNNNQNNQNNANRPLDSSLDRIHISELMPDMTFNQNMDLNLGSGLSMHLNGGTDL